MAYRFGFWHGSHWYRFRTFNEAARQSRDHGGMRIQILREQTGTIPIL